MEHWLIQLNLFGEIYSWNKEWTGKRMNNWYEIQQYLLEERMEI